MSGNCPGNGSLLFLSIRQSFLAERKRDKRSARIIVLEITIQLIPRKRILCFLSCNMLRALLATPTSFQAFMLLNRTKLNILAPY